MHTILYPVNALHHAGAEQQLLALVRGLDKGRYRPIVAPLYPGGSLDAQFRAVPGVTIIDLDRRGKYDPSPLWKLGAILHRERVAIIQPFLTPSTFFGLIPALAMRTPVKIVTERCGVRKSRGAGYKTYRTIEDWLTRFADSVVPNSRAGADLLRERGIADAKIQTIYNGLDRARLQPDPTEVAAHRARFGVPAGGKVVGILATLTPAKDHATFLRAAAIVAAARPDTRFAIIGEGALRGELTALAASLGLTQKVTFCGYQTRVADYLAACDLLVSSSRDNEGASNSILEGMALGVPVVATNIGGNGELVQDGVTGHLTAIGDHAAIAAATLRAFVNPAETATLVANARQLVKIAFSHEGMVAQYEELYARLLAAHGRATTPPIRRAPAEGSAE
ncbi:MAG TPA: glycosyltransferase [Thermomicrobiales bacterium]|jgi:glycosyltransferase involved in cell wall biosynthesis